ncbi:hypothetical protein TSUD_28740 [Trifolium subterraneum]|uniref:CUE domain-containing protein n=1 Tax=Trifolium subterraneum TaxID=3900 RepID=A0A2Z6P8C8_TRISU|nr:hypothetical protein TSUD_28740 [Trifolium subterraneum]
MGFNSVYRSLQDIFPQVDSRLLRAVAIEHPKDADMAAEVVLTEIIPSIAKKLLPVTPPQEMSPKFIVNLEDESEDEGERLMHHQLVKGTDLGSSSSSSSPYVPEEFKAEDFSSGQYLNVTINSPQDKRPIVVIDLEDESVEEVRLAQHQLVEETVAVTGSSSSSSPSCSTPVQIINSSDSLCGLDLNVAPNESTLSNATDVNDKTQKIPGINGEGYLNSGITKEISWDQLRLKNDVNSENLASLDVFDVSEIWMTGEAASMRITGNRNANNLNDEWVDFVPTAEECETSHRLEKCETAFFDLEGSEMQTVSHVQGLTPNAEDYLQKDFNASPSTVVGESSDVEDEIDSNKAVGQYNPACSIDMLEETIEEAKTNKKTLFSSMESLISLMREVELQEKAAEQANMEAARGGSDILDRVEEYKAMLVHAKEANDMHAGEIYGEKAILATELKELQSRLCSLSDERDNSLSMLDEMRQSLESRLAAAEMLRKSAELEKLEKERSAKTALLEQESMMEKVVQEARRLKQDAEENSKVYIVFSLLQNHFIIS